MFPSSFGILVVTAALHEAEELKGQVDAFLTKPVQFADLMEGQTWPDR